MGDMTQRAPAVGRDRARRKGRELSRGPCRRRHAARDHRPRPEGDGELRHQLVADREPGRDHPRRLHHAEPPSRKRSGALLDISAVPVQLRFQPHELPSGPPRRRLEARGYGDIIVFNPTGNVVYSVDKHDELGTNFAEGGPYADTGLGRASGRPSRARIRPRSSSRTTPPMRRAGGSQTQLHRDPGCGQGAASSSA